MPEILELESFNELDELQIEWDQLLPKCLDNHPFLTYDWLTTWWRHFGQGRELRLLVAREKNTIPLIAPLMYSTYKVLGVKLRKVEFIATPASDYHVFLLTNFQDAAKALGTLMKHIAASSPDAECIELEDVPEDSNTARLLEGIHLNGCKAKPTTVNLCPYVALPSSFDIFLRNLGSSMRRNLKRWEKQTLKDYRIDFVAYDKIGTVERSMQLFFELHQKRWMSEKENGLFSNSVNRNFHVDLARRFAREGWLNLFFLTFNDEPVSATYSYEYNGKLYAYLTGFDPDYARYRPGYLAFKRLIKYGVEKKLKEFDLMRGAEDYKTRLRAKTRRNLEYRLLSNGFKAKVYDWITNSKPLSRLCRKIGEKMNVDSGFG